MSHEELQELLAGYALDVLDRVDREALEAHVATCPTCPAELDGLRDTAGMIGLDADPVSPPPALRARILDAVAPPARRAEVISNVTSNVTRPDPGYWRRFASAGGLAAPAASVARIQ